LSLADAEGLRVARAAFDRLSTAGPLKAASGSGDSAAAALRCLLTPEEQLAVEAAVDDWCEALCAPTGCLLVVGGKQQKVSLSMHPLALVLLEQGVHFPIFSVEHIDLAADGCCSGRTCNIRFARRLGRPRCAAAAPPSVGAADHCSSTAAYSDGGESDFSASLGAGPSLEFSFPRHVDRMGFGLCVRALQLLAPELEHSDVKRPADYVALKHLQSACGRQSSKESAVHRRPACLRFALEPAPTTAAGAARSEEAVARTEEPADPDPERAKARMLLPTRSELEELFVEEERVQAGDTPSAAKLRHMLPDDARSGGEGGRGGQRRRPDEFRRPEESPSAKGIRKLQGPHVFSSRSDVDIPAGRDPDFFLSMTPGASMGDADSEVDPRGNCAVKSPAPVAVACIRHLRACGSVVDSSACPREPNHKQQRRDCPAAVRCGAIGQADGCVAAHSVESAVAAADPHPKPRVGLGNIHGSGAGDWRGHYMLGNAAV